MYVLKCKLIALIITNVFEKKKKILTHISFGHTSNIIRIMVYTHYCDV